MEPIVTAKSFVFNERGELLVLWRSPDSFNRPGQPDLPGGHVDEGENFEQAAIREIAEETGIAVVGLTYVYAQTEFVYEKNIIRHFFTATVTNPEVVISPEHTKFDWLDHDMVLATINQPIQRAAYDYGVAHQLFHP